eukprot:92596_1
MAASTPSNTSKKKHRKNTDSLQIPMVGLQTAILQPNDNFLGSPSTQSNASNTSNGSSTTFMNTPRSYSEEIISQLTIKLKFLLDENSPLNKNIKNYGKRFQEFNPTFNMKQTNKIKNMIRSLSLHKNNSFEIDEINSLYKFWDKWKYYSPEDEEDNTDSDDDFKHYKPNAMAPQVSTIHSKFDQMEEEYLKKDYLHFMSLFATVTETCDFASSVTLNALYTLTTSSQICLSVIPKPTAAL